MTANIPVSVKAIINDLPKIKAQTQQLNAEEKRAIKDHLSQVSFQRRLESEINRELKEQIAQRRRLTTLSNKLNKDLASQGRGGGMLPGGGSLLTGVATLGIGAMAADFAKDSFQMSAASERLEKATDGLGMQFGLTSDEIVAAVKRGSDNTISSYDAMLAANKALLFGITENEEQFEDLTKIAVGLGRAMGQDAKSSLDDLTTGIGRQSRLILDNLGLLVSAEQANRKYAQQLGKTVEELTDAERQQAFTNETLEQGRRKLAELGDQQLDTAGKVERLTANWEDFQTEFGKLGDVTGIIDGLNTVVEGLVEGAESWQFVIKTVKDLDKAFEDTSRTGDETTDSLMDMSDQVRNVSGFINPLGFLANKAGEAFGTWAFKSDQVAESLKEMADAEAEAAKQAEDAAKRRAKNRQLEEERLALAEEMAEIAEKEAKRLEKVADIRERSIRKMLDIDRQFAEDVKEIWADWREDQQDLFEDYGEKRADILEKAGKDAAKIEKDLAKDLSKLSKDTTKDLAKVDQDEKKKLKEIKEDAAKSQRQEEKKRRVDVLADERLFQFDLRQLAAEGNANAIQEALERRAIEEQIEKEKQQVESQIKDENLRDDVNRIKEEAEERRDERRAEAEERRAELEAEAEEERQVKEEALQQALEDEKENFIERSLELAEHRRDKLAQLEEDKKDTIAKIGEELTEISEITKEELAKLIPVFAEFGDEAGSAFSAGLSKGFEQNKMIEDLLGQKAGSQSRPSTTAGRRAGLGKNPGMLSFADGGIVPGPLGQPQLAVVHGGETITPVGGSQPINITVSGVGADQLAMIMERKVNEGIDEYNTILAETLA